MQKLNISDLVGRLALVEGVSFPELVMKPDILYCEIGGANLDLSAAEFAMLWMFAIRCKNSNPPIRGTQALLEEFLAFAGSVSLEIMHGIGSSARFAEFTEEDAVRTAEVLSRKMKAVILPEQGIEFLVPVKPNFTYGILMPATHIFCPRNY